MSKKLIFRNKCFLRYILIIFRQLLYVRTTSYNFFFSTVNLTRNNKLINFLNMLQWKIFLSYFFVNLNFYNFILKQLTTYILCMYQNSNFVAVISSNTEQNFSFFNRIFFVYDDQRNQKRKKKELHAISRKKKIHF